MKKKVHFLRMISNAIFFLLVLISSSASGQSEIRFEPSRSASGESKYRSHFSKYALGTIDQTYVSGMLRSASQFDTLMLVADGISYKFSLEAKDIRADNFKLIVQSASGMEEMPRSPNVTYSGMTWDGNLPVCITADDQFFTAMITSNEGAVFIESAKLIDPAASADQFVIYHEKDLVRPFENSMCGTTNTPGSHTEEVEKPESERSSQVDCRTVDVAIANDYAMYTKYGSDIWNVQLQNLAVMNLVSTNFDFEFNDDLLHRVVAIYVYTSASGSPWYTGTDPSLLLSSFVDWAPTGFGMPHDVGSLWTNRDLDGSVIGYALLQVLCDSAYNILQDFSPNYALLRVLQAHEFGHNYGANHDASPGYIMSSSVENTNVWSSESLNAINNNFTIESCLSPCPFNSGGRVGIGTTLPDFSAALDITSTTKGLLIPRMTPVQREAMPGPAEGLMVYDIGSHSFWFYKNGDWVEITDGSSFQAMPNNNVTFGMSGNAGVGVETPTNKLDIATQARTNLSLHPTNLPVYITGSSPDYKGLEVRDKFSSFGIGISPTTIYATGSLDDSPIGLLAKGPGGYLYFRTNAIERMRITGAGNVGIGTGIPDASSALEIWSTSKGLLIPRMNTAERNAIASPQTSLLVFDNSTNSFWYKGTSSWVELSDNLDTEVFRNGPDKIYMGLTDSVGIGTNNPAYKLDVRTATNMYGISHSNGNIKITTYIGNGGEIGTKSNHGFRLFANDGLNQFELLPNGNIGIGVLNAGNRWDIHNSATARTGTHPTGLATYITGNFGSASNGVEFRSMDAAQGICFGFNTIYAAGANPNQSLFLASKGTGGLYFTTNAVERLSISGAGNVGLSVPTPANKLDVQNGTARTNTHNTGQALYVTGGGEFRSADATTGLGIGSNNIFATGANPSVDLSMAAKGTSGNLLFLTNGLTEKVRITNAGNVGIGTSAPNAKLQFANNPANRMIVLYEGANNDHEFIGFGVDGSGALRYQTAHSVNDHIFYSASSSTSSFELMRITGSGLVGIGVQTPHAPLQFSNSIIDRKIVLHETANNNHQYSGFGVQADKSIRYQVPDENAEHNFYYAPDASTSFELMSVGFVNGIEFNRSVQLNGNLTTTGNVTLNGTINTESFIEPTLLNSFSNFGNSYATAAFYKDKMGVVHLRGVVTRGANHNGISVFVLPAGYRPSTSGKLLFTTQAASGMSRIDILPDGNVVVTAGSTGWIGLDGITFRAD